MTEAYGASGQGTANVHVNAMLMIAAENGSAAVKAGDAANFTFDVASSTGTATFSCSGLPAKSTCSFGSFTPATSSASLTPGTVGLTISTTATTTALANPPSTGSFAPVYAVIALPFAGLIGFSTRRKRQAMVRALLIALFSIMMLSWASCGGGHTPTPITTPGTPARTYTVTVTATNADSMASTTVQLTVQ